MAESLALSLRLTGFEEATVALRQLGQNGQKSGEQVAAGAAKAAASTSSMRSSMAALAGIGASTAAVLSIFARNNTELQDALEKATVAMTLASSALRGVGAAMRFLTSPIGLVVAAIGAGILVFLNWETVSNAVTTA